MVTPPPTGMDKPPTMSYSTYSSDKMTFDASGDDSMDDAEAEVGRPKRSIKTRILLFMTRGGWARKRSGGDLLTRLPQRPL